MFARSRGLFKDEKEKKVTIERRIIHFVCSHNLMFCADVEDSGCVPGRWISAQRTINSF